MSKLSIRLALLLAATALPACAEDTTGSSTRAIIDTPCAADTDCPTGFECEIEEQEDGTTTSFCQADEDSDGTCPPGYELEIEHGQTFCKLHGDEDEDGGVGGSSEIGDACASDADCAAGLECEVEVEDGVTTSWCQPHGG